MKKASKLLSLVLAGAMTMSLAACGGNETPNEAEKTSASQTSSASAETGTETKNEERPKITVALYDRGNVPTSEGTILENRWTKWIQENAPVDVEFVAIPRWESGEKYNALFASGTAPDLIEEFGVDNMNTFYANGLLMPLNDLIENSSVEYKAILEEYPVLEEFLTKDDGQMYTFGVVNPATTNHYLVVRTDWLENLNMSVPETDEEFMEMCKAFTNNDPDGNGENDTLALSLAGVTKVAISAMYGGMGSWQDDWYKVDPASDSKEMTYHWDHAEAYVGFMKELYDAGCVSKDFATDNNGTQAQQDFINGKIGVLGVNGGKGATLNLLTNLKANNPDADFEAIPLPVTEFGAFQPAGGGFLQSNAAINADCENPEAVMKYIDWLNTTETLMQLKYGGDEYSQLDEATGQFVPKDPEKFKTEVGYTGDMRMTVSGILDPYVNVLAFDESDPIQKRAKEIVIQADKYYLDTDRVFYQLMTKPSLPNELNLVKANIGTQIDDIYIKAIIGGDGYTVEQAMTDAKKIFTDAGGDQITEYINDWQSKNNGFVSTEDLKKMLPDYVTAE